MCFEFVLLLTVLLFGSTSNNLLVIIETYPPSGNAEIANSVHIYLNAYKLLDPFQSKIFEHAL